MGASGVCVMCFAAMDETSTWIKSISPTALLHECTGDQIICQTAKNYHFHRAQKKKVFKKTPTTLKVNQKPEEEVRCRTWWVLFKLHNLDIFHVLWKEKVLLCSKRGSLLIIRAVVYLGPYSKYWFWLFVGGFLLIPVQGDVHHVLLSPKYCPGKGKQIKPNKNSELTELTVAQWRLNERD